MTNTRWSAIATHLPGRTDNEIKNFWNTHLKKKLIQMGFDPMTHRPRTDIFSSLPHLIALANFKDLMENNSWEEQAVRLQTEVAKLQYLQYLLQPPTSSNYHMPNLDMDTLNLLNSLPSSFSSKDHAHNLVMNPLSLGDPNPFEGIRDQLPGLHTLEELPANLSKDNDSDNNHMSMIGQEFTVLSQGENSNSPACSDLWLPSLSSSPSPPPPATTAAATPAPPVDGSSSSANSFWPDLLLEDSSLFHDIA